MVKSIIAEEMSEDKIAFPTSKKRLLPSLVHSEGGKENKEEEQSTNLVCEQTSLLVRGI